MEHKKIAIIGLGYVGLPLAVEFGKKFDTIGFDIDTKRVEELSIGQDKTLECDSEELLKAERLKFTSDVEMLRGYNVFIITVPTPIDKHKQPDLGPLVKASKTISKILSKGDIVIYESTVYPGATEEVCIPVIELNSGLKYNIDFFAGYSPERINPGDKLHRVTNIKKVTSGSNPEVANIVNELYLQIIEAGTHKAPSIKVAEASKVIENVQRDVNIALVNELYQILSKLDISTKDVIDAASTKWNFMKLYPGIVGGHCIGVDPYYLLHKSSSIGYIPDLMRKAREINDSMADYLVQQFMRELIINKIDPSSLKIALLGFTFKENCPDIRNTRSYDLYMKLTELGLDVSIIDDWANSDEVQQEYGVQISNDLTKNFDAALLLVPHQSLIDYACKLNKSNCFVFDYKGVLRSL
ncbi:nucleotide sugar dehydrogenase [Vibrio coralliirubri]|uniref:nucleotide sugar dehydrogenase n=1 Tax=Vibrio coralliirubri TaxID=1516159 RepID=UPI000637E107|nr:nucleotide sugar dehydrogenase [Vibrio coralliirubri]CDS95334.1 Vi polysaccharide biosynthesis protein vipA/tviB [Vibrio coralliirubri]